MLHRTIKTVIPASEQSPKNSDKSEFFRADWRIYVQPQYQRNSDVRPFACHSFLLAESVMKVMKSPAATASMLTAAIPAEKSTAALYLSGTRPASVTLLSLASSG